MRHRRTDVQPETPHSLTGQVVRATNYTKAKAAAVALMPPRGWVTSFRGYHRITKGSFEGHF